VASGELTAPNARGAILLDCDSKAHAQPTKSGTRRTLHSRAHQLAEAALIAFPACTSTNQCYTHTLQAATHCGEQLDKAEAHEHTCTKPGRPILLADRAARCAATRSSVCRLSASRVFLLPPMPNGTLRRRAASQRSRVVATAAMR
jgi:hypothetical protein